MKKVMFLLAAFFVVGLLFTSCTKTNTQGLYEYTTDSHIQASFDDVSALDDILRPKLHHGFYHLTNDEAHAEWNSFMQSAQNVNVSITGPGHYYTIKFVRREAKDGAYVIVETIGEHTWNSENN